MIIPKIISILAPLFDLFHRIPQLHKKYRTKKVSQFSFYSLALLFITNTLWLGYYIYDISLIISSSIAVIMDIIRIMMYIMYV